MNYQTIHAFDLATGEVVWRYERPIYGPANVVARDGRVLFAGSKAVALEAATGRELWRYTPDSNASFSVTAADERAFYFGTEQHQVYAVDVNDGTLLWNTDVGPDWPYHGIVRGVSVGGDTLYAGLERYYAENGYIASGMIFALDRYSGEILWSYEVGSGEDLHYIRGAPRVAGRFLIAADYRGNAYITLDRFTGKEIWRYVGDYRYFGAEHSPVVRGDTVFAASQDKQVTAFDLATGEIFWQTEMPGGNIAIALCGNRLLVNYFGLAVLDPGTGEVLGRGYEYDNDADFPTTGFAVAGDRAYVLGVLAAYGFQCPSS
ncbi:MAG: PQQ-binding-like beta-propeller repeat protein [Acidobacteriota bacterium]